MALECGLPRYQMVDGALDLVSKKEHRWCSAMVVRLQELFRHGAGSSEESSVE